MKNISEMIKEYMTFEYDFDTFFMQYCNAKGINLDDPEDLSPEKYLQFEEDCKKRITEDLLYGISNKANEDIMERIFYAMAN